MALKRKRCNVCKRLRYVLKFYVNKKMSDGFHAMCKDCWAERSREWHKRNRKSVSDRHRKNNRRLREEIIGAYGGKCACCGETTYEFLTVDHVKNDGSLHRQQIGQRMIYRWLKENNFPKRGFQLLCYNCNLAKARYGKCPHQKERK